MLSRVVQYSKQKLARRLRGKVNRETRTSLGRGSPDPLGLGHTTKATSRLQHTTLLLAKSEDNRILQQQQKMASEPPPITKSSSNGKNELDAYQLAPKELKDLWKSWTKAKPPFEIPGPSSLGLAPENIADDILERVFARFVLDHLSVLFAGDLEGLERFAVEVLSPESASAFSLENVKSSVNTNRRSSTQAEFRELSSRLMGPLMKSFKSEKNGPAAYNPRNIPGRGRFFQLSISIKFLQPPKSTNILLE